MSSAGAEVVELAAAAGLHLDPWQQHVLHGALGERADGKWSAFEVGLLVARQNGKGALLEALGLAGLFLFGERLILHSAHEFKTAGEAFLRIKALVQNCDDLRKLCKKPRTSHGEESIERLNGQRLRFVARSRSSGRGFSGDRIILDEAQELPLSAMGALLPTLSARPNPQVIYTGTVPDVSNNCEHFTSVKDRGRKGDDLSLAWYEWSPPIPDDGEPVDLDDRDAWAAANPALGHRMVEETIARERNSLSDDMFSRERLSIWPDGSADQAIPQAVWVQRAAKPELCKVTSFAVEVAPDRSRSWIAAAGRRRDGRVQVEVVEQDRGTGWVAGRVAELAAKYKPVGVAVDPASPAGSLIPALSDAGVEVEAVNGRELAQACGAFYDAALNDDMCHLDDPFINAAVTAARKKVLGDSWSWSRKSSTDISPLVAVTLAMHSLATAPAVKGPASVMFV